MSTHVAILLRPYLRLILSGRKTIESRLTRNNLPPYRRIRVGERIYFKASAGPYMASAIAAHVEFHDSLTPAKVERLRARLDQGVCGRPEHWHAKRLARYATFIWLRDVQALTQGPAIAPSHGPAWFVLDDPKEV